MSVTTIGGTGTISAGTFTFLPAPTCQRGLAPTSGPTTGGTSVVITGTGFTGATAVKFGATNATTFTVNSRDTDHRDLTGRQPAQSTCQRHHTERHRHIGRHLHLRCCADCHGPRPDVRP